MKKILYFTLLAAVSLGWSCSDYDDSELFGRTDELAARIEAARQQLNRLNDDLKTYAGLVASLDNGSRRIVGVTEAAGTVTITYDNGDPDVLYCGSKGETGDKGDKGPDGDKGASGDAAEMPLLRIDTEDGYWKVSTDGGTSWTNVLDASGQPVKGTGEAGKPGQPGSEGPAGKAPVLGIDAEGYWTADYGDGAARILDAAGRPVIADTSKLPASLFLSARLSETGDALIVELISGERIEIPVADAFVFMVTTSGTELFRAGETRTFPLQQRGIAEIGIERPEGWGVKVSEEQIEITAPTVDGEGEIVLTYEPHKADPGTFHKVVQVLSNSSAGREIITIRGNSLDR